MGLDVVHLYFDIQTRELRLRIGENLDFLLATDPLAGDIFKCYEQARDLASADLDPPWQGDDEDPWEVGGRYNVYANDCCVRGAFAARVMHVEGQSPYNISVVFDNGVTLLRDDRVFRRRIM